MLVAEEAIIILSSEATPTTMSDRMREEMHRDKNSRCFSMTVMLIKQLHLDLHPIDNLFRPAAIIHTAGNGEEELKSRATQG